MQGFVAMYATMASNVAMMYDDVTYMYDDVTRMAGLRTPTSHSGMPRKFVEK